VELLSLFILFHQFLIYMFILLSKNMFNLVFLLIDFSSATFRDEIAGCSEKAYDYLSINDVREILLFSSERELLEYIKEVLIIVKCLFPSLLYLTIPNF